MCLGKYTVSFGLLVLAHTSDQAIVVFEGTQRKAVEGGSDKQIRSKVSSPNR